MESLDDTQINCQLDFTLLGIDSINVFTFTSQLKEIVPEIPLTIFLECKNLDELQEYLLKNHYKEMENFFNK